MIVSPLWLGFQGISEFQYIHPTVPKLPIPHHGASLHMPECLWYV